MGFAIKTKSSARQKRPQYGKTRGLSNFWKVLLTYLSVVKSLFYIIIQSIKPLVSDKKIYREIQTEHKFTNVASFTLNW